MIVVIAPLIPVGASVNGIVAPPGTARKGVPFIIMVLPAPLPAGTGIFVGPETAINGVLLMIVKLPVTPGGALAAGMLVGPGTTRKGIPPIRVVLNPTATPGAAAGAMTGIWVGPGTAMKGVLLINVIGPVRPGGAAATGIFVAEGIEMKGDPSIIVAPAPGMTGAAGGTAAKVVGAGTTMNAVPPMLVVSPVRPGGAAATGILVGAGIIT